MSTRIKYLVLARTKKDAHEWARRNGIFQKEWKYAGIPCGLLGINNLQVVRLPGCEENRQFYELEEMIKTAKHYGVTERALCKYPYCDALVTEFPRTRDQDPKYSAYCAIHHYAKPLPFQDWLKAYFGVSPIEYLNHVGRFDFAPGKDFTYYVIHPGCYQFGDLFQLKIDKQVVYNVSMVRAGRQRLMRTWFTSPLDAVAHSQLIVTRFQRIYG